MDYTHERINLSDYPKDKQEFAELMTAPTNWNAKDKKTPMFHDVICEHNSGHLCEHRLKYILDNFSIVKNKDLP